VLLWKGGRQAAAAPSQNWEGVCFAVGTVLAVACLPLAALMASLISVVREWLHNDVLKFGLELVPQGS